MIWLRATIIPVGNANFVGPFDVDLMNHNGMWKTRWAGTT